MSKSIDDLYKECGAAYDIDIWSPYVQKWPVYPPQWNRFLSESK